MAWFKLSHCKLCWRISFAVFALIFAIESLLLIPSAQRFRKTERQRLAGEAQIVIDPILMHVRVEQLSSNLLSLVGSHGIISVAIYDRHGKLFLSSHDAPEILSSGDIGTMASPLESSGNAIVRAAWRSSSLEGVIVLVSMDGAGVERELLAHVIRILGLVAIVVLFVTVGTMMVLHIWVLQPLLTLRASSIAAGADPEKASRIARNLTAHGELGELIAAHRNMLTDLIDGRKRDQQIAEERARFLTHHDTTTGLPNRRALLDFLSREELAPGATLLTIGSREISAYNSTYGFLAGEQLLSNLSRRLRVLAEPDDFIAHLGGDRFALAAVRRTSPAEAASLATRLIKGLGERFEGYPGTAQSLRVCIGIANGSSNSPSELLIHAELALDRAQENRASKYEFFSAALAEQVRERQALARDLEKALRDGELYIVLQPQIALEAPRDVVRGAEVLVRWNHLDRGAISPIDFIPLAEETGLILPLGNFVLRRTCSQIRQWLDRYGECPRLAVNLSAQQFIQADLLGQLKGILAEFALPEGILEIEITESSAMLNVERTATVIGELRKAGIKVSIDDFGTGYSSLAHLRRFDVDAIKIDKSFVDDIGIDRHGEAICDAILRLGQSLQTKIIAEGVEREDQVAFLRRRRCDEAQGYLFGRPVRPAQFESQWLAQPVVT